LDFQVKKIQPGAFRDEKFRELTEAHFGKEAIDRVFSEHDAAPEEESE
jgi:hypothetical protein